MSDEFTPLKDNTIDSSMAKDWQVCHRRFYWRYVRGYELIRKKPALVFGAAIHAALAVYYGFNRDSTQADAEEAAIAAFHKEFQSTEQITLLDEETRTAGFGEEILAGYFRQYPLTLEDFAVVDQEVGFAVALETSDMNWGGRIDLYARGSYGTVVVDHKTTDSFGLTFPDQFTPSTQIPGYIWAMRQLSGECDGAVINLIGLQKTPKSRVLVRLPLRYSDTRINTTIQTIEGLCRQIEATVVCHRDETLGDETLFAQSPDMCVAYWRAECPYRQLCLYDRPLHEVEPSNLSYQITEWEPWKK